MSVEVPAITSRMVDDCEVVVVMKVEAAVAVAVAAAGRERRKRLSGERGCESRA